MQINVVLIGAGNIAGAKETVSLEKNWPIITHIQAILANPHFNVVAVVDSDIGKAEALCKKWKLECACTNLISTVFCKDIDGFIVATNPSSHEAIVKQIFGLCFKPKFILLEKPGGESLAQAEEISRLCEVNECALFLNYQRNYSYLATTIKEFVGKISHIRCDYVRGLRNDGSHAIAFFLKLLHPHYACQIETGTVIHDLKDDPTPNVMLMLDEETAMLCAHDGRKYDVFRLDIFGEDGMVTCGIHGSDVSFAPAIEETEYGKYKTLGYMRVKCSVDITLLNVYKKIERSFANRTLIEDAESEVDYLGIWEVINGIEIQMKAEGKFYE